MINFSSVLSLILQETSGSRFSAAVEGIKHPDLSKFLVIAAILFIIGVAGVLVRRNIIVIFMSIELILNAANLNFIAFSRYLQDSGGAIANPLAGQVFTVFIIVVAAAEAAIGLGIVIALYRNRETIWVDEIDLMKW